MNLSRRTLLRGAGGMALALPFLEATARGAAAGPPLRLLVMVHGQGTMLDRWTPSATGAGFALPPLLAPLAPFKDKINVLSGINNDVRKTMNGNGHNPAARSLLSAHGFSDPGNEKSASAGPSIDQVIARRLAAKTALPSLELRVGTSVGENQMIFSGSGVAVAGQSDPQAVWTKLTSLAPSASPAPAPAVVADPATRLRAKRGRVLDVVGKSLDRARASLSGEDKLRIDAHAERVAEMQSTLASPVLAGGPSSAASVCTKTPIELPAGYGPGTTALEHVSASAQIKNAVMALSCDLTRVVTLQFCNYHAPTFDWLNAGLTGNWHDRVHSGGGNNVEGMAKAFMWYSQMFHDLLAQLAAVNEGAGSLLDNTLVVWLSEFGNGGVHSTAKLPVVMAGGLGGRLATGRHLAFTGRSHNDLHTTILNLFGQDDTSFGHPSADFNKGPLALT